MIKNPDYKDAYSDIYDPELEEEKPKDSLAEQNKDGFIKTPNLEAAAIFHFLAKQGTQEDQEEKTTTCKFWCMSCCVQTEFPDKDTALDGNCKKCKEPIFSEEEKVK